MEKRKRQQRYTANRAGNTGVSAVPDNELLTETFQTACKEQKRALKAENNSDGVKKQKGKKTVTCISPVNVRTEPNVSTSQLSEL